MKNMHMSYMLSKEKVRIMENYEKNNINNKRIDKISKQLFELVIKTTKIEESQKYIKEELLKINKHLEKPNKYTSLFLGITTGVGVIIFIELFKLIF